MPSIAQRGRVGRERRPVAFICARDVICRYADGDGFPDFGRRHQTILAGGGRGTPPANAECVGSAQAGIMPRMASM